ncbi:hypothetical protein [Mycobacterium sp. IS-3022]|uniref:hypothetical protein n=1 Tax=Mycobacterium sp. IS-3022 TaxID=1772277 RepID=UPI00155F7888|nr:hypothetical protein [Mycobacterium sp. IS-3022]
MDRVEQAAPESGRPRLAAARRAPSPHWSSSRRQMGLGSAALLQVRREVGEEQVVARRASERMVGAVE